MTYLTVKETSELIRCSEKYTYKLIQNGVIPAIKINSKILVDKEQLSNALNEMKIKKEE
ncbi:helix-turn-helix domain-containing protein [Macrococcoides caseolyticum]|uniref:helix-turn-helix domain-containing protein n=1 Tax=Macrococcoides caseolyticum TaxID=69966 RepID=UPI000C338389|nr:MULTISPECIES: helix-turn-helix domain-containing protein [Macrococcus]PKE63764.1 DNA-binding protein [Macrococcus caseolyticus]TDM48293.1 DNA-binding protein [Macrococcus goetzii]